MTLKRLDTWLVKFYQSVVDGHSLSSGAWVRFSILLAAGSGVTLVLQEGSVFPLWVTGLFGSIGFVAFVFLSLLPTSVRSYPFPWRIGLLVFEAGNFLLAVFVAVSSTEDMALLLRALRAGGLLSALYFLSCVDPPPPPPKRKTDPARLSPQM